MSVLTALQLPLRSMPRYALARRQWIGACLLVSYIVGTVGLPAPLAGPGGSCQHGAGGVHACCCSTSSVLAGTCCCAKPVVQRSCCSAKPVRTNVRTVLRESVQSASTRSCCDKSASSTTGHDRAPKDNELRVSGCPCGPGAPDASFVCADPRLATNPVVVTGAVRVESGLSPEFMFAPGGALEPLTPPPRAVA